MTPETPTKRTTIYCPAPPELYAKLDTLRRAKQRQTGKRVSLAEIVLELVRTHPYVTDLPPGSPRFEPWEG